MLKEIAFSFNVHSAIINSPDSEMKVIFLEGFDLLEKCPEILLRIQHDIDAVAKQKKRVRLEDAAWYRARCKTIPGMECTSDVPEDLFLCHGRPRKMDAELTFFMLLVRGLINSVTSKTSMDRIVDSKLIDALFAAKAMALPAVTTIHDYLQAVTLETLLFIFEQGLNKAFSDGYDGMESLTIDSFSVAANSKWPTDSRLLMGLLNRAHLLGSRLVKWGFPGFSEGHFPQWFRRLKQLDFTIALTAGKPNSRGKIKKYYRQFLKIVDKALSRLIAQFTACLPQWNHLHLAPSVAQKINEIIDQIQADIHAVINV